MHEDLVGLIGFIVVMAILLAVLLPLLPKVERFVPEFLDQGNVKKTVKTGTSSYDQETNHFKLTPPVPEPIDGSQTPFRVNMFNSYTL
jgi:hypothetical protein